MPHEIWDPALVTLRRVLDWVHIESRRAKRSKTEISHRLAQGFVMTLERKGANILETGHGNANYFCVRVDGAVKGVSPFASHEKWWEKPSEGFRQMVKARGCEWGVALFLLHEHKADWEGLWIEGIDFDSVILKGRQKVNADTVRSALDRDLVRHFTSESEFLNLLRSPLRRARTPFRIPKKL